MSKVIKGSDLFLFQPKVIDLTSIYELKKQVESENLVVQEEMSQEELLDNEIILKQVELEELKQESKRIVNETEKTVIQLLDKVREESRSIIAEAREEAEVIRQQAVEEAHELRVHKQKEGYEVGLKKAQEEIEADRLLALQESQRILEEARQNKVQIMKSSEADMVRLVMAVAKKIIGGELETNPQVIINILREGLNYLDNPKNITVYVNPREVEKIFEVMQSESFNDIGSNEIPFKVSPDKRVEAGGCTLESDAGSVDARLETRIASVEKAIQEVASDE
ncbi:MAG: FliH/SctL family protein [Syntrophomonas sp.]|uniref:FliH/SctL family protein n=1 Tax=Syntrophomonas sp. TaxID=2053627 RepID=UPI002623CA42|nr:FliH/SctL family protein [Syntrophomonas sp.]MDD4625663.1 FliH/SctL family protein [Syntrophomonas sp.]